VCRTPGATASIYLNAGCQEDIVHCDISAGTGDGGQVMDKVVAEYFDFAGTTEAVNAAGKLNLAAHWNFSFYVIDFQCYHECETSKA